MYLATLQNSSICQPKEHELVFKHLFFMILVSNPILANF